LPLELLRQMAEAGMAGIEVDHPDHPPLVQEKLAATAAELGLVATGGSDFHGDEGHILCRSSTTPEALDALRAAAR
jgi:predicted metal-dependent phosphoesterase TrpH